VRQTLPKSNILRGYQQFSNVIKTGVCLSERLLCCYVHVFNAAKEESRNIVSIGFSVPKKRVPLAVHRNKVRRLMREAVRKNFHEILFSNKQYNVRIVVMFKGGAQHIDGHLSAGAIEEEWKKLQQQIQAMV
jgi:ribonuclease P protein component